MTSYIRNLFTSIYGWAVTVFFAYQCAFLYFAIRGQLPTVPGGTEDAVTASLMISVHVLVAVNTLAFLLHSSAITSIPRLFLLQGAAKFSTKVATGMFLTGLWLATLLSSAMALTILAGVFRSFDWRMVLHINEAVCILMFFLFVAANSCGYVACRIALTEGTCSVEAECIAVRDASRELVLFLLGVDIPGFLGIVFIWALGSVIFPTQVRLLYWEGFAAGAIGLHVAFSQTALALLKAFLTSRQQFEATRGATTKGHSGGTDPGSDTDSGSDHGKHA